MDGLQLKSYLSILALISEIISSLYVYRTRYIHEPQYMKKGHVCKYVHLVNIKAFMVPSVFFQVFHLEYQEILVSKYALTLHSSPIVFCQPCCDCKVPTTCFPMCLPFFGTQYYTSRNYALTYKYK